MHGRRSNTSITRALRRRGIAALVVTGLGALAAGGGLVAGATASASSASGIHMVPGYLAGLNLATKLGAAPAGRVMRIAVEVQRPNTAGELSLYHEQSDPHSAQYHHFLTPAQFQARFGVTAAQSAAVAHWLTGGGLTIETRSAGGDYFTASGTVAQLDSLLHVAISDYVYKNVQFIANDAPPSVPNAISVAGIAGLDTLQKFALSTHHTRHLTRLDALAHSASARGAVAGARAVGPQAGDESEFTPQELWGVYDDPGAGSLTKSDGTSDATTVHNSSLALGQGQTIGIFGEGETSSVVDQLRLFETAMGLPKVTTHTIDTEGGPASAYGDNTGAIEWYLDSQASTGMAPDVSQLDFYFAKTLFDADIFKDFDTWANDPNGPREMNASFGECEENPTNPVTGPLAQQPYGTELGDELQAMGDPILRQAAMEGRTLFSSAGDTGSGCPELVAPVIGAGNGVAIQPVPFVSYPCDSEYVVCVGGTVVSAKGTKYPTSAQRSAETSWTDSGGGSSHFVSEPSYQQGVQHINLPCVSTPTGTLYLPGSAPTCRGVPDVADLSGNITFDGYFIYIDGEPASEGGTSLSSPLMMGQWARVQAAASSSTQKAGGVGFADPVIYRQAQDADGCSSSPCANAPTYNRDFFDVTDSEYGAGNGAYQPGPGWDYASGWGSLNVANFIQDVDGTTTAADAAAAQESPATQVTTASMTSPAGNATDPIDVSIGNDAPLDLTKATLTTSPDGKTITATLTGPSLGSNPPADATGGITFYVAWEYNGKVEYAQANESQGGGFSYSSGNTGTYGDSSTYGYTDTTSSKATGSISHGTVTINVPASEVGAPPIGAALTVPQAFDQLDATPVDLDLTTDSSDAIADPFSDGGKRDSIGQEVIVGGAASPSGTATFGGAKCTRRNGPVVHAKAHLTGRRLSAHGVSSNHGCTGRIRSVGIAFAKVSGKRCRFLNGKGRFGRATSCTPKDFLRAKGTTRWTFTRRTRFGKGVYKLWAHATNTHGLTTRNTKRKFIFLRPR